MIFASMIIVSCCGNNNNACSKKADCKKECTADCSSNCQKTCCNKTKTMGKFQKKYTNADFYTDGKFNEDVAIKAMKEMMEFYGITISPFMEENFWVAEFGLGDFENCGMGGIFWVNDAEHGYFGHTIYLLPGQMIPEHKHVPTKFPAKFESWMVDRGWTYNFSEVGEATADAPAIPASQKSTVNSKNCVRQNASDIVTLKEIETWHFLYAGDEGAIVSEYACYHDGDGLRFSNPKAKM